MARILIVVDEATDQRILRRILEEAGHIVFAAWDGEQAYKAYLKNDIDIVVTDLLMPKVDGIEFIEALLSLFPDASIIAVSGAGEGKLVMAQLEGASATLGKPIDPSALLEAVSKLAPSA